MLVVEVIVACMALSRPSKVFQMSTFIVTISNRRYVAVQLFTSPVTLFPLLTVVIFLISCLFHQ